MIDQILFKHNVITSKNATQIYDIQLLAGRLYHRNQLTHYHNDTTIDSSGRKKMRLESFSWRQPSVDLYMDGDKILDCTCCNCETYEAVGICEHIVGAYFLICNGKRTVPRENHVNTLFSSIDVLNKIQEQDEDTNFPLAKSLDFREITGVSVENNEELYIVYVKKYHEDTIASSSQKILNFLTTNTQTEKKQLASIMLTLKLDGADVFEREMVVQPRLIVGKTKMAISNIQQFIMAYRERDQEYRMSSKRTINFNNLSFDAFSLEMLTYLPLIDINTNQGWKRRKNLVPLDVINPIFQVCAKHNRRIDFEFDGEQGKSKFKDVIINDDVYSMPLIFTRENGQDYLEITEISNYVLWNTLLFYIDDNCLYTNLTYPQAELIHYVLKANQANAFLTSDALVKIAISEENKKHLIEKIQTEEVTVRYGTNLKENERYYPLSIELRFDRIDGENTVSVAFTYGETTFNPLIKNKALKVNHDQKLEQEFLSQIEELMFEAVIIDGKYYFSSGMDARACANQAVNHFVDQHIKVYIDAKLQNLAIKPFDMAARISLLEGGILNIAFDMDETEYEELQKMMRQYRQKKRYVELKSGVIYDLHDTKTQEFLSVFDAVEDFEQIRSEDVRIPSYHMHSILDFKDEYASLHIDDSIQKAVTAIGSGDVLPNQIDASIKDVLRPYQLVGVYWLQQLAKYNLGGILADDMGLGKTLQAIALIQSMQKEIIEPILIVAPKTLTYNWQSEFTKFAPNLVVTLIAGNATEREEQIANIRNGAIVITSYPLLAKDIKKYKKLVFGMMLIDEAQHIKTPTTLAAKAVKLIPAKIRYALTGTPLENNVVEVWSIFDYIMPGFLGKHRDFVNTVAKKIGSDLQQQAVADLRKKITPFILRRLKKDVLTDLPSKINMPIYCEMEKEQEAIYRHYFAQVKQDIASEIAQDGFQKSQIKILALLTRLRQVCVDPNLFIENYDGQSAKMDALMELLEEAISGGHKILVFSQFTTMLELVQTRLEKKKIGCFYLHGQIPGKKRLEMVNEFNEQDERNVFLLSLKAGGTGLNLTSADIVVHVDPWWNPSTENQASDRAHRFGQKNDVFVYELIVKNTIEEKILELKRKKAELFDALFNEDSDSDTVFGKLTEKEILGLF